MDTVNDNADGPVNPPFKATVHQGHIVQFYETDDFLVGSVAKFIGDGLSANEAGIVIAFPGHLEQINRALISRGFDLERISAEGRYVTRDAAETISRFMAGGMLDAHRFAQVIGGIMEPLIRGRRSVRVYGEMVALLWQQGNHAGAIRLERLWNGLAEKFPFSLLCGYPLDAFGSDAEGSDVQAICAQHAEVIPAESYTTFTNGDRLRSIVNLQQRASALSNARRQRENAETMLRAREKELTEFLQNAAEGVQQIGADGRVLWANRAMLELLGYSADEYIGHHEGDFWESRERFNQYMKALTAGQTVYDFPAVFRCKDGSTRDVLIRSNGFWQDGQFVYTRCFIRDMTERVWLEGELRRSLARLAETDRRKDEFLAMLAHELRNPLAAIKNALAALAMDGDRHNRIINIAQRQTTQLARIVDDLLDVARITRGRISLQRQPVSVAEIVERTVEQGRHFIESREHHLAVELSAEARSAYVNADPARLQQVLGNLVHNAAKFTDPGGTLELSARCEGGNAIFRVRDNGAGIAPEMLAHVFELFHQSETSLDRAQGGLGIGLTLAQRLIEMHGGQIVARSEGLGKGSEFEVRLPLLKDVAYENGAAPEAPIKPAALKVLIVDDNFDAAESLRLVLEMLGHQASIIDDGPKALDAIRRDHFDVALVDIGLPGMDGYEVAQQIRRDGHDIVLCALTGYSQTEARQRALAAGVDHHFVKPLNIESLEAVLAELSAKKNPASTSDAA